MERFETKYDLLNRAYADIRLKRTTKAVMQYLVIKSDHKSCHPSVETIAAAIKMSERTVQRHMRYLEQYGYIIRRSRYYRMEQLTNQYEFVLDVIDSKQEKAEAIGKHMKKETIYNADMQPMQKSKAYYIQEAVKTGLTARERLVYIYMIHKANKAGIVYGSRKLISKQLHMSRRLLYKTLADLRKKGFLQIKDSGNLVIKIVPKDDWEIGNVIYPESKISYHKNTIPHKDGFAKDNNIKHIRQKIGKLCKSFLDKVNKSIRHFLS
jgi:biotin operon repressor/predicted DNA-binding transcriptional regulator